MEIAMHSTALLRDACYAVIGADTRRIRDIWLREYLRPLQASSREFTRASTPQPEAAAMLITALVHLHGATGNTMNRRDSRTLRRLREKTRRLADDFCA